jgi:hypothetical protein
MSRLRLGAATLVTAAVLLVGCASDSKKALTGTTETTANASGTTASAAGSATTTANGDTNTTKAVDNSAATTTQETTPTSGDALPGLSGKCKEKYASYLAKVGQLGSAPDTYKALVPLLNELLAGAPPDVQAAAKPTLDAFGKLAALIDKYNGDIAKASQDPDFAAVEQAMSSADARAADTKIEEWLKSTCGS